jgi:phospholipase/carboxylesterase
MRRALVLAVLLITTPASALAPLLQARPSAGAPRAVATTERLADGALLYVPSTVRYPATLLLWLHGATGTPERAINVLRDAADETGVVLLLPKSTEATWDVIVGHGTFGPDVARIDAALAQVFARMAIGRVAIGGFSDGASYALSLGLANGQLFRDVLAFAPCFRSGDGSGPPPRVLIVHGTEDRILPFTQCGVRLRRELTEAGVNVTFVEHDGGHVQPPALIRDALRRLQ